MGGQDAHVAEAGGGQPGAYDVQRQLELVAFAAEVRQENLPQRVAGDVRQQRGGGSLEDALGDPGCAA
jgi:hypothetical protein